MALIGFGVSRAYVRELVERDSPGPAIAGIRFLWKDLRPEEACGLARAAAGRWPDDPAVLASLGHAWLLLDEPFEARRHLRRAVALDPASAKAWLSLYKAERDLGHVRPTALCLLNALELFNARVEGPRPSPEDLTDLARVLREQGRCAEAQSLVERALGQDRDNTDALLESATLSLGLGDVDRAIEQLLAIIELEPYHAFAYLALTDLVGRAPEPVGEVAECYAAWVRRRPDAAAASDLAQALLAVGLARAGCYYCRIATRVAPQAPIAWLNLGCALGQLDEHRRAVAAFRKALSLAPHEPTILRCLGVSLDDMGRPREALECFYAALRIDPSDELAKQHIRVTRSRRAGHRPASGGGNRPPIAHLSSYHL